MNKDTVWQKPCALAPSLLSFDLCNLERQVEMIADAGIGIVHIDIVDGHFSPSMPVGIETIAQLRRKSDLAFDVHLMATRHEYFVDALLDIGVQQLAFHIESEPHADRLIDRIRAAGVRASVALKPSTSLSALDYVLDKCDTVLLMLINPGYAGSRSETQVSYAERKITELRELIDRRGLDTSIEIDGRVSKETIRRFAPSIVDIFVAGSACISKESPSESLEDLVTFRNAIADINLPSR